MSKVAEAGSDRYRIAGCLSLSSAMEYREEALRLIPADRPVEIDLSDLEVDGSAALALLIHLVRRSHGTDGEIRFLKAPDRLRQMAEMGGLKKLLVLEG